MLIHNILTFDREKFLTILKSISGIQLFNPYTDLCNFHDKANAFKIRESNLRNLLGIVDNTESLLVGEAPGYLGCRRTGLAFTDNRHLAVVQQIYKVKEFHVATKSGKDFENSALFMWRVLERIPNPPLVWNLIPIHPYLIDDQLSNRTPRKTDFEKSNSAIRYLIDNGEFRKILAIGRVAHKYLTLLGFESTYIRHPSHGGSNIFKNQMENEFSI